jgi:hypothetical protein
MTLHMSARLALLFHDRTTPQPVGSGVTDAWAWGLLLLLRLLGAFLATQRICELPELSGHLR